MAKFCGIIGYGITKEDPPGVWNDVIIEKKYYGDIVRNNRRLQSGDKVNDNINISNQISIISDPYANENFHAMRYIKFMGTAWKITTVEVQYPRLILDVGGVYNGPFPQT